jgi:hypothetical protein
VLVEVTPEQLRRRKETGLDRWDEMWEGVLHMAPAPLVEHRRILAELIAFLVPLLKRTQRGVVRPAINVFNESSANGGLPDPRSVPVLRRARCRRGRRRVHRDSKHAEVHRLTGSDSVPVPADREGWVASVRLGARFRTRSEAPALLVLASESLHSAPRSEAATGAGAPGLDARCV